MSDLIAEILHVMLRSTRLKSAYSADQPVAGDLHLLPLLGLFVATELDAVFPRQVFGGRKTDKKSSSL